ncbi:MAG TPA: helix-turn-helix transcriptional regulator [Verrucomicrobiae bacterium]|jgi:AraC-like DNA-binding protein|nr:helix-turn-helix transcriptional regulator [Verrucomicrobiae bacterium]
MNTLDHLYEPHLTIRKFSILPGKEWFPGPSDWSLIQVEIGVGYWLRGATSVDLEPGSVILASAGARGHIRASQLNSMSVHSFGVMPSRLTGLITLNEQDLLKNASAQTDLAVQVFPASRPIARRMHDARVKGNASSLLFRLSLLQLFVEIFGGKINELAPQLDGGDARDRLRSFLATAPPDVLSEMSFDELARVTRCTPRHLSRIFFEQMGMSFSDKRAEIRLARACELLATSQSKVVEVAFESGYKSLSLFNQMFARRFGISPGKWRQRHRALGENRSRGSGNSTRREADKIVRTAE